jgi:hypothetical protein
MLIILLLETMVEVVVLEMLAAEEVQVQVQDMVMDHQSTLSVLAQE